MINNEFLITYTKVLNSLDMIFDRCQEIDPSEYRMLPDIQVIRQYIYQQKSIVRNALEMINYDKKSTAVVNELSLYYFDKCADFKGSEN